MSRQTERQQERAEAKQGRAFDKLHLRQAQRARLDRQTAREKSGFYDGLLRSVADAVSASRSRITSRKVRKGQLSGRILFTKSPEFEFGRERQFHATKGWRSYRA